MSDDLGGRGFAVVVPACAGELPQLVRNLLLWSIPDFFPFEEELPRPVTLHVVWNDSPDPRRDRLIEVALETAGLSRSFSGVASHYCRLPPEEDHYDRDPRSGPVSELGFYPGPNRMFFDLLDSVGPGYESIFLMETDCFPLRRGWIDELLVLSEKLPEAWVIGSRYCGIERLPTSKRNHLNGNAIYRTGSPEFREFSREIWKGMLARYAASREPRVAYDSFPEELVSERTEGIDQPEVARIAEVIERRFRETETIRNYGALKDNRQLRLRLDDIRSRHPDAAVVHGRWFSKEADELVETAFPDRARELLGDEPPSGPRPEPRPAGDPVWLVKAHFSSRAWTLGDRLILLERRAWCRRRFRVARADSVSDCELFGSFDGLEGTLRVSWWHTELISRPEAFGFGTIRWVVTRLLDRFAARFRIPWKVRARLVSRVFESGSATLSGPNGSVTVPIRPHPGRGEYEVWIVITPEQSSAQGEVRWRLRPVAAVDDQNSQ